MKKIRIFNILVLLLLLTGSCQKYVEGYEKDPNGLLDTNDKQLFQGVLLENQFFQKDDGLRLAMLWLNQATGSDRQMIAFNNWNSVGNNQFNNPWGEAYTVIGQATLLEDKCNDVNNIKLRGVAKLMRAWAGGTAASLWGDVPFEQAGQPDLFPNPKYDNMADVFTQVQILLDDAIVDLNDPIGDIYSGKDIYFAGDVDKWVKIAHGLKARFYLHAKDYANAKAEAAMGPASPEDDMYAQYASYNPNPAGKWNPTFNFYWNRDGYLSAQDAYGVSITMEGGRDNPKTTDILRGYYNYEPGSWWGSSSDYDLNIMVSQWFGTDGKFGGNMELVTYGEMLLIQTEAEARANGVAAALPFYNEYRNLLDNDNYSGHWASVLGVTAPFNFYLPYDVADFDAGGMENQDNIDPKKAFLRELFEERYVFFIGDYESFTDFGRTKNDADVPLYFDLKSGFSGEPLRFIYPQSEIDANANFIGTAPEVTEDLPMYH